LGKKDKGLIDIIKGPVGFVLALFVTLVMAGMSQLTTISAELQTATTTIAGFFVIYMIIWVLNYLR
jgi:uncharacterized membrane protein required for colicin V production